MSNAGAMYNNPLHTQRSIGRVNACILQLPNDSVFVTNFSPVRFIELTADSQSDARWEAETEMQEWSGLSSGF